MSAPTIAQKIQSCICCIVVFSGGEEGTTFARLRLRLGSVASNPSFPLSPNVGVTAATLSQRDAKKGAPKVEGGPRPKEETVLVATTTTSTTKASIRFAAFLCEISGSYLTFPPSGQAGLLWPTSGNRRQQSRRRYATNGFALSPIRAVFLDSIRLGCRNRAVK